MPISEMKILLNDVITLLLNQIRGNIPNDAIVRMVIFGRFIGSKVKPGVTTNVHNNPQKIKKRSKALTFLDVLDIMKISIEKKR